MWTPMRQARLHSEIWWLWDLEQHFETNCSTLILTVQVLYVCNKSPNTPAGLLLNLSYLSSEILQ